MHRCRFALALRDHHSRRIRTVYHVFHRARGLCGLVVVVMVVVLLCRWHHSHTGLALARAMASLDSCATLAPSEPPIFI